MISIPPEHRPPRGLARGALVATALLGAALIGGCSDGAADAAPTERQAAVAERGADVMPFDLDATTHRFEPTSDGLVQTVTADDPADAEQVALIREHLIEELDRFADGDFEDPAAIHGADMPGLAELRGRADDLEVALDELPGGARLTFTTDAPALVEALHRWGEAQVSDHGAHAEH